MFQKAAKTVDTAPPVKQKRSETTDSQPEKSFDFGRSVFTQAQTTVKHSSASAAATTRDESKTVSCFRQLT